MKYVLISIIIIISFGCKIKKNNIKPEIIELCLGCGYSSSYSKDFFKIKMMYQATDTTQLLKHFKKNDEPNKFYCVYYLTQLQSKEKFKGDSITNEHLQSYRLKNTSLIILRGCTDLFNTTILEFYQDINSEKHSRITKSLENKIYWYK